MLGDQKIGKTARCKDTGTVGEWADEFEFKLSEEDYNTKELVVRADNESIMGGLTFIAEGKKRLFELVPVLNSLVSVKVVLGREGKPAGTAHITLFLSAPAKKVEFTEAKAKAPAAAADKGGNSDNANAPVSEEKAVAPVSPPSSSSSSAANNKKKGAVQWKLTIEEVSVKELYSSGNSMDKQDPCVKIWFNDTLLGKSQRLKDAGTACTFPEQFTCALTESEFKSGTLKLEVYNESMFGGLTHVGVCTVGLGDVVPEEDINDEAEVTMQLVHEDKKSSEAKGKAHFFVYVDAEDRPVPTPEQIQEKIQRRKAAKNKLGRSSPSIDENQLASGADVAAQKPNNDGMGVPRLDLPTGGDEAVIGGPALSVGNKAKRGVAKPAGVAFLEGKLHVKTMSCSDLGPSGSKVFFSLELHNSSQTHETVPETKKDGMWHQDLMGVTMDVERYHVHGGNVTIKYFEKTMFNSRKLVGTNTIPLDSLLLHVGENINLTANLVDERHAKCGHATLQMHLEQINDVAHKSAIEEGFESAVLEVSAIKLTDLKHTNATFSSKVNRPYVSFTYADAPPYCTTKDGRTHKDAIVYDHLTFERFDMTAADVKDCDFNVEVWDQGITGKTLLGSAVIGLDEVRLNKTTPLVSDIMNDGSVAGTITLFVVLDDNLSDLQLKARRLDTLSPRSKDNDNKAVRAERAKAVEEFPGGRLVVKSATAKNLPNVELGAMFGDKSDPYLVFEYNGVKLQTDVVQDAGSSVHYRDIYFTFDVKNSTVLSGQNLTVSAYDHNSASSHVLIGTQSIVIADHILEFDDDNDATTINTNYTCKLRLDLVNKKNEPSGQVVLECMMKPSDEMLAALASSVDVPETFQKGVLQVKKVLGQNLTMNRSADKTSIVRSPYLMFDYCDNGGGGGDEHNLNRHEKTGMQYTNMGSGSDPSWPVCSYKQRVTKQDLRNKVMTVYVYENGGKDVHNTDTDDDDLIAVGKVKSMIVPGSTPGHLVEVVVELFAEGKSGGKQVERKRESLGTLTLFVEVTDTTGKDDVVKTSPRLEQGAAEEFKFTEGLLCLSYVVAKGLDTNGRPFVSFKIEDAPETEEVLPVLTNASGDLHWDVSSRIPVNIEMLKRKTIQVTATEQNRIRSNNVIGHGEAALNFFSASSRINKPVELSVQLFDAKGKSCGRIILGAEVRPLDSEMAKSNKHSFDAGFTGAQVQFVKIQTHNLKNTELMGKADPYIKIIDSDGQDIGKTFTLFDKGGSVLFDYLDIKTSPATSDLYSADDVEKKTVTIEAWDDNTFPVPDKFVGRGVVRLRDLKGPYDREAELPVVPLVDDRGNAVGRVHVNAKLVKPLPPKDAPVTFPDQFTAGVAYIRRISGFGIKNVNLTAILGNKADPYVTVQLFPNRNSASATWSAQTAAIMDSGDHALWDFTDMEFPVDRDCIAEGVLLVTAMDKNVGKSDAFIGAGVISLKRAAESIIVDGSGNLGDEGKSIELSVDLNLQKADKDAAVSKGGKSGGRIVLHLDVARAQPTDESLVPKHDFEFGTLAVSKVRTFDLRNTETMSFIGGLQDPYVKLKFADWEDETHPKEDAGSDVLWDFLAMESPVYLENVLESKLEIAVYDQNTTRKDVLIGKGEASIKKAITVEYIGKEIKVSCALIDDQNKASGRVEVYLSVTEAQMGGTVPEDFDLGILTVKKALLLATKGKCARPNLNFSLRDQSETLEQQSFGTDEDPRWDMNWKAQVDSQTARGAVPLEVTVTTKSMTGSLSTFGTARVDLVNAAVIHNLGKDVQLSAMVYNAKEKKVGRVVLFCAITRDIVKSLPVTDGLPKTFTTGTIIMHTLKVRGDMFKKRKIYCRLEHSNWNECTSSVPSGKAALCSWNFGDDSMDDGLLAEVNKDSLLTGRLRVVVLEEGSMLKGVKELAHGTMTSKLAARMCSSLKQKLSVKIDLQASADGAHETVGLAELSLTLSDVDMLPDNDDGLPDNSIAFKSAILQVKKVSAIDLRGGDLVGKADPFVKLSIDNLNGEGMDWKAQTEFQEGAGRTATWDNIDDILTPVTRDAALFKRLRVTAYDHNNITSDAFMGSGDIGLRGTSAVPNEDKLVTILLKDKNHKSAGKIELTLCMVPDVDMTSGIDRDGDGIDDGLEANMMQGNLDISSIEWKRGAGRDSDNVYPVVKLGGWKAVGDVQKSEGNSVWQWGTSFTSEKVSSAHIAQKGLHLFFRKASGANPTPSDKLLGEMKIIGNTALATLGEWVDVKGDFVHDGEFKGKYSMTLRFTPLDERKMEEQKAAIQAQGVQTAKVTAVKEGGPAGKGAKPQGMIGGPGSGDQAMMSAMDAKHADMEAHMQKEMKRLLAKQTADLRRSMEELEQKAMRLSLKKPEAKKDQLDIFNVTNVQLPPNINDWKTAHVQAWLAFDVELPAYMDSFRVASIDGHMLIRYVDDKALHDNLGVAQPFQRKKIMDAIELLKEKQEVVERKSESLRRATLRKEKAEDDAELRRIQAEEEAAHKRTQKKVHKKPKKSGKKKGSSGGGKVVNESAPRLGEEGTMYKSSAERAGAPSEQNQIDRVRLERAARAALLERQRLAAKMEKKSGTWKFEYNGAPMPTMEGDIWGDTGYSEGEHPERGTKGYESAMATLDPLNDADLRQGNYRRKIPRMRVLPKRCTSDEVLAAVKESFYHLSNRLAEVQRRNLKRTIQQDEDLLSVEYSVHDELEEYTEGGAAGGDAGAGPAGGDETAPPAANEGSAAAWETPPPLEEWANDDEKADYLAGAAVETTEAWEVPPPVSEWDDDDTYKKGVTVDENTDAVPTIATAGDNAAAAGENDDKMPGIVISVPLPNVPKMSTSPVTKTRIHRIVHKHTKKPDAQHNTGLQELTLDRMELVYHALINQTNNNASFIGTNDKLTRLKLLGGLESICRLKLSWSQFETMWTRLDMVRTGDLDLQEFKNFFGDLSEYENREGVKTLTLHNEDASMRQLSKCLADMCDTMRHAGFTVEEMFCCFDRNGNGTITPSEFCSLLRLIIGPTFDKKLVFEALLVLDSDHDKAISRHELFMFVYRTWKMQLDEIDYRKCMMDPENNPADAQRCNTLNMERNLIRGALRKNFNRQLRDLLDQGNTQLSGPFATLLGPNSPTNPASRGPSPESTLQTAAALSTVVKSGSANNLSMSLDFASSMPLTSSLNRAGGRSQPGSPTRTGSPSRSSRHNNTNGQIMRFKIKAPGASSPTRTGATLTLPKIMSISLDQASPEATEALLRQSAPLY
jgi:hypothetical protein